MFIPGAQAAVSARDRVEAQAAAHSTQASVTKQAWELAEASEAVRVGVLAHQCISRQAPPSPQDNSPASSPTPPAPPSPTLESTSRAQAPTPLGPSLPPKPASGSSTA